MKPITKQTIKTASKFVTIGLLIGLLIGAFIAYGQSPTSTFTISTGIYPGAPSYTIWNEGSDYFAKDANGFIGYSGTNFTTLSTSCISALPSNGGKITIEVGAYAGHIVIDRSNVILEGEGGPGDIPVSSDPGKSPSALLGTVITPEEGQNGVYIEGANRTGVQIRNLGIWFKTATTGHGITTDKDQQFHLRDAVFENIAVLGVDATHYGLSLCNFLFVTVHSFRTYGGCILELYGNLPYFQQGNSVFDDLYNEVTETLNVDFANGPYPVFVHPNDTISSYPWYQSGANLLTMRRIQVNTPTAQSDPDFYQTCFFALKISTIEGLDLEGVTSANKTVQMGSCQNVEFLNAYMWAQNTNCSLNIASNNIYVTWINPFINGAVLDSNETDSWINPLITGDILTDSRANFVNLVGNSGVDTLTSGQASVTVSAKFIGPNNYVLLTIIDADALAAGEDLKVSTLNVAPTNTFVVQCIDEGTASVDISFYWQIVHIP
jgi:hypothetical protein